VTAREVDRHVAAGTGRRVAEINCIPFVRVREPDAKLGGYWLSTGSMTRLAPVRDEASQEARKTIP
jgi:hypothetical protein